MAFTAKWDVPGEKYYETGCDRGMLYVKRKATTQNPATEITAMKIGSNSAPTTLYDNGVAWSGITSVSENPSGAEANDIYADNVKYASIRSAETFNATIEAYMYPDEFAQCDGSAGVGGVMVGQQARSTFGFSFRTDVGNDEDTTINPETGYKIHLIYGATAAPSSTSYSTINESPDAITFSWELSTTPVSVGTVGDKAYLPTARLIIDTTKLTVGQATHLEAFESILYGDGTSDPVLPMPADVIAFFNQA